MGILTICVIPARMGSSRYPNKPMTPILSLGTRFTAFAGGTELQRHGGIPFSDRFAPKVLAPGERQAGSTPIGYMFPDIKKALGNQKVVVQWKYSDQLHGELQINRNPCK